MQLNYLFTRCLLGLALGLGTWGKVEVHGQSVTVQGTVTEDGGRTPVEGATVLEAGTANGVFTGEDGRYTLTVPRAAQIQLLFRYFSQDDTTLSIQTEPGVDAYTLDLAWGSGGVSMSTQVITAGRHAQQVEEVVGSMEVIQPGQVDLQSTNDVEEVLQQSSGVDIIDGQPSIRGSSGYAYGIGSRVMVMLDGLPLLSSGASVAQFDLIPTDNLAQIEVMKGASSVLYGSSALGGVINAITSDAPATPKTSIRLRGQVFDAPANPLLDWDGATKSPLTGGISAFHSRKLGRHDLTVLGDYWASSGFRQATAEKNGRLMAMTKFRPEKVPGLTFGANASARFDSSSTFLFWDSYLPGDSVPTFGGEPIYNSAGAYSGQGSARRQLNTRYTFDPFVKYLTPGNGVHMYRGRLMIANNTNDTEQNNVNTTYYNDYQFTKGFAEDRLTLVTGATFTYNRTSADSLFQGFHKSYNSAAYLQMDYKVTEWLNITAGGRFDHFLINDTLVEAAPVFRFGANVELRRGTNLRASWGQAFRSPSIAERYTATNAGGLIVVPNPEIQVEKGWSGEVGIRQGLQLGDKKRYLMGFVDVAGFVMDFDNMVEFGVQSPASFVFPPPPPVFSSRNVSAARITGIEATTLLEVGIKDFFFNVTGGVTYIEPVNQNGVPDSALVDLLNTLGPQEAPLTLEALGMYLFYTLPDDHPDKRWDNPTFLKYRSRWLTRFSATVGYGRFALTTNYRYKSELQTIDQFLYIAVPGSADFVLSHPGGFATLDFIAAVRVMEGMKFSLNLKNAFNEEYAILPGIMGEPRSLTAQLKYVF